MSRNILWLTGLSLLSSCLAGPLVSRQQNMYGYMALWNGSSPAFTDPIQNVLLDCWLPAATISVVHASPDWVSNLIYWPDGTPMAGQWSPASDTAIVTLWNPSTDEPLNFTVSIYSKSKTEDHPYGNWWNSAITQAMQQMAGITDIFGIFPNGTIWRDEGLPSVPMAMMTGYPVTTKKTSEYESIDEWFDDLTKGIYTPVVVSTNNQVAQTEPKLYGDHAYAVLNTTDEGNGIRYVTVRNPWGATDNFDQWVLFNNTYYVNYLTNFDWLQWNGNWPGH